MNPQLFTINLINNDKYIYIFFYEYKVNKSNKNLKKIFEKTKGYKKNDK